MFRVPHFRTRATHRRTRAAAPVAVVCRDTMARRQRPSDSTQVMPAVTDDTSILPAVPVSDPHRTVDRHAASAPLPPSQQPHPVPSGPWRPQVGGDGPWAGIPVAEVQHDRRSRRVFVDLAAEVPVYAEDSYQSLASYGGQGQVVQVVHIAAVNASWFRTGADNPTFNRFLERFAVGRGAWGLPSSSDHPAWSLDTQEYTVVGHPRFANDTYGKAAA